MHTATTCIVVVWVESGHNSGSKGEHNVVIWVIMSTTRRNKGDKFIVVWVKAGHKSGKQGVS